MFAVNKIFIKKQFPASRVATFLIIIIISELFIMVLFSNILSAQPNDKIDINSATKSELETIPSIGPLIAGRITEYRKRNNGFKSVEELTKIKGIGEERLSEIILYITISIPKEGEIIAGGKAPISPLNKLDINRATKRDFELLPGIGPKTAENIIEYRNQHNRFRTIQELLYIKGIGESKFDNIRHLITIEE